MIMPRTNFIGSELFLKVEILIENVLAKYKLIALKKSITLKSKYSTNIPLITCNPDLLIQVFVNLNCSF